MDGEIVQHALTHAVFESPYLSPTPLRDMAVALQEKVPPLAQSPIKRFIERNGTEHAPWNKFILKARFL